MPRSKHRDGRRRSPVHVIRAVAAASAATVRELRAERRAVAAMPKPVPWDWAQPRLLPLLAGPYIDRPGEQLVRSVLPPGVAVTFGIDLGHGVLPFVDSTVAERWECRPDQICAAAMENLERRAARFEPSVVATGTLSGHPIRLLQRPAGWATSVLLVPNQLKRLFGEHDQIFVAATHKTLISVPIDAPGHIAWALLEEFELGEPYPLMLDPFFLEDGTLFWRGAVEYDDNDGDDDDYEVVPTS